MFYESRYDECHTLSIVMLSVIMLDVILLNAVAAFQTICQPLLLQQVKGGHLITNQQTKTLCGGFLNENSY
jgi:hypothetical protein